MDSSILASVYKCLPARSSENTNATCLKSGVFAGWWGSISGVAATGDETIVTWTNWACETAHVRSMFPNSTILPFPFPRSAVTDGIVPAVPNFGFFFLLDFAGFHEISFKNVTDILTAQGEIRGTNLAPSSAQSF